MSRKVTPPPAEARRRFPLWWVVPATFLVGIVAFLIVFSRGGDPSDSIALALADNRDDMVPIPGTRRLERLEENIAAVDLELSESDFTAIEAAFPKDAVIGGRYR